MRGNFLEVLKSRFFPSYEDLLKRELLGCKSILDLGCGKKSRLSALGLKSYVVGVDILDPPEVEESSFDEYIKANAADLLSGGTLKSTFEVVVALDLIEHLEDAAGYRLIETMTTFASKKIIIFTPNGFLSQSPDAANPYQEHLSGWKAKDFLAQGFKVYGVNGIKPLRGEKAQIRFKPERLWEKVSRVSQGFVYRFPNLAFQIFCVKYL